jgi:poly(hydroxyalkanoate) depolymerase family esterase
VRGDVYEYAVYVPSSRPRGAAVPLVVVLHGCTMTPDEMAAATGYDALAERAHFLVLYPDVDATDVGYGRCWKGIWDPGGEIRGRGDAGAVATMTEAVAARWHADRSRVYAIGISAGAFESTILAADYPDLYAAVGIHSGAPYMGGLAGCLGPGQSPAGTDALARGALGTMGSKASLMPVIVFHGDGDSRIPYRCGREALAQWLRTDQLILARRGRAAPGLGAAAVTRGVVPRGRTYTVTSYSERRRCPALELWTVHGMGHFWSGGSADPSSARFSDPRGPSATAASWAFFSRWRLGGRCAGRS